MIPEILDPVPPLVTELLTSKTLLSGWCRAPYFLVYGSILKLNVDLCNIELPY